MRIKKKNKFVVWITTWTWTPRIPAKAGNPPVSVGKLHRALVYNRWISNWPSFSTRCCNNTSRFASRTTNKLVHECTTIQQLIRLIGIQSICKAIFSAFKTFYSTSSSVHSTQDYGHGRLAGERINKYIPFSERTRLGLLWATRHRHIVTGAVIIAEQYFNRNPANRIQSQNKTCEMTLASATIIGQVSHNRDTTHSVGSSNGVVNFSLTMWLLCWLAATIHLHWPSPMTMTDSLSQP